MFIKIALELKIYQDIGQTVQVPSDLLSSIFQALPPFEKNLKKVTFLLANTFTYKV